MRIGFTNGCFDVLHVGHIELFSFARSMCDKLIVAIDADERVKESKGPSRPFNKVSDRKRMLESIRDIDEVRIFSTSEELENLVREVSPDIMVVGSDYEGRKVIGREYAKELKFFRRIDGHSTTKILEDTLNR